MSKACLVDRGRRVGDHTRTPSRGPMRETRDGQAVNPHVICFDGSKRGEWRGPRDRRSLHG
jgi:hypothetical protein